MTDPKKLEANDPTSQTPEETAFWQRAEEEIVSKLVCGDGHPIDAAHVEAFKAAARTPDVWWNNIKFCFHCGTPAKRWKHDANKAWCVNCDWVIQDALLRIIGTGRNSGAEPAATAVTASENTDEPRCGTCGQIETHRDHNPKWQASNYHPYQPSTYLKSSCSRLASRVEELERALKIASCQLAQGSNMDFSDANIERWQEDVQRIEQQLLIEAREDLAKHSGSLNSADSASNSESSSTAKETR